MACAESVRAVSPLRESAPARTDTPVLGDVLRGSRSVARGVWAATPRTVHHRGGPQRGNNIPFCVFVNDLPDLAGPVGTPPRVAPAGATPRGKRAHTNRNDRRDAKASTPGSAVHSRGLDRGPSGVNGARVVPAHVLWGRAHYRPTPPPACSRACMDTQV